MIARLIQWSIEQRVLVLLGSVFLAWWGWLAVQRTPIDALPDLSDVQVIIRTEWPGRSPRLVEDQITYPMTTGMLSVPGAKTVRGYSFFGDSFVYVLFEDGTDPYWARSRVLEYLAPIQTRLPAQARASLGPDASGVGWIYEYALVDRSGKHDLSELRALQDWLLRFELKSVAGVAEVASIGGMVRQFQIVLDPHRLLAQGLTHEDVMRAVLDANGEIGGSVFEIAEAEYMVRAGGYLKTLNDFNGIVIKTAGGIPVRLQEVAKVQYGPEMRRGVAELDGEGEVTGAVVVMRAGHNARDTIAAVKSRLAQLQSSLPRGVEVVEVYDRSILIDGAIRHLRTKLIEEFIAVAAVCLLFLFHLRSALVAVIALPLGVLTAFIVMQQLGVSANIMSLGGIAIAIGAMIDAAIVMIENAHKHIEAWNHQHPDTKCDSTTHWRLIREASIEVGPPVFFSLLIITLSFVPVFSLQAQEGRLFAPLALTKTIAMAAAAGFSITLVPVLMGYWIRGRIRDEGNNPVSRILIAAYRPVLRIALNHPRTVLALAAVLMLSAAWPIFKLGREFMPMMDEGDLLYMPSTLPGISAGKAAQLLQQTDRMIRQVPEVAQVFGKAGRAESATDPAPMEMFETTIRFKPKNQWRAGMTTEKLIAELDRAVQVPGLANLWVPPIRNRIDMLSTGIKSPIGIKINGSDPDSLDAVAVAMEQLAKAVPGVRSALAERNASGRYIDVLVDTIAAARVGLSPAMVNQAIAILIGGESIGETIDGRRRISIQLRYPREWRDDLEALRNLPLLTPSGARITLSQVATIQIQSGPSMVRSENARLSTWIYVDIGNQDLTAVVKALQHAAQESLKLPAGVSVQFSGQFEYYERAVQRLQWVVPATLFIIFILLYLIFRRLDEAVLLLSTLPFALIGSVWLLYALDHRLSIASAVGLLALAGVAAEFGVIMLLYLRQAWERRLLEGGEPTADDATEAIETGAVLRVRPKAMTVAVILAGLMPIFIGGGPGAEVMQRIAAPMVGGMLSAPLLSMIVIPVIYHLQLQRRLRNLRGV